jgi:hypothetical protein
LASAFLLRDAVKRLDDATRGAVLKSLTEVLPQVVQPGALADERTVRSEDLRALIPAAAVSAAGLDPKRTPTPPPPVLWEDRGNRLLVQVAGVQASLGDGFIDVTVPVSCDETGDTSVIITFVTGSPDRPTGGVTTTEDHPRGPAAIVENWHEPLIAFAWQTVLIATSALAAAVGTDVGGAALITNTITVTADGLSVAPMAQHAFVRTSRLP